MNWKTCSLEAEGGISKRPAGIIAGAGENGEDSRSIPIQSVRSSGMQNHPLTMFERTCYSSLVPRVHPGLLCAVGLLRCVSGESAVEL